MLPMRGNHWWTFRVASWPIYTSFWGVGVGLQIFIEIPHSKPLKRSFFCIFMKTVKRFATHPFLSIKQFSSSSKISRWMSIRSTKILQTMPQYGRKNKDPYQQCRWCWSTQGQNLFKQVGIHAATVPSPSYFVFLVNF